jgi:hypothetical protein
VRAADWKADVCIRLLTGREYSLALYGRTMVARDKRRHGGMPDESQSEIFSYVAVCGQLYFAFIFENTAASLNINCQEERLFGSFGRESRFWLARGSILNALTQAGGHHDGQFYYPFSRQMPVLWPGIPDGI